MAVNVLLLRPLVNLLTGDRLLGQSSFEAGEIRSWNAKPNQENSSVNTQEWSLQCFYDTHYSLLFITTEDMAQQQNAANKNDYTHAWIITLMKTHHLLSVCQQLSDCAFRNIVMTALRCLWFISVLYFHKLYIYLNTHYNTVDTQMTSARCGHTVQKTLQYVVPTDYYNRLISLTERIANQQTYGALRPCSI